jgi:hypothetical protein
MVFCSKLWVTEIDPFQSLANGAFPAGNSDQRLWRFRAARIASRSTKRRQAKKTGFFSALLLISGPDMLRRCGASIFVAIPVDAASPIQLLRFCD